MTLGVKIRNGGHSSEERQGQEMRHDLGAAGEAMMLQPQERRMVSAKWVLVGVQHRYVRRAQ